MQKREILTFVAASLLTLVIALPIVRYFAPQLLGLPADLQMVQVAEEIPPYFEGVFRDEDFDNEGFIIKDPYVQRAKPLFLDGGFWGPHDLLGFRNPSIPVVADVVTIGDSVTYGMGAVVSQTWPRQLEAMLAEKSPIIYNMAIGGWGAVEYLRIFPRALRFRPRVVIVAFYSGNDPRDTFSRVYRRSGLEDLRLDPAMEPSDLPAVTYPAPESEWWETEFRDGYSTIFTPKVRHGSNLDHPTIDVAYSIMTEVARRIQEMAGAAGVRVVFTIFPTKELVLAPKVEADGIEATADFRDLIRDESRHVESFAERLRLIPGATYVDIVSPLQQAALESIVIYPTDIDGHPAPGGHRVVAESMAAVVDELIPPPIDGAVRVVYEEHEKKRVYSKRVLMRGDPQHLYRFLLIRDRRLWRFRNLEVFEANGWKMDELPSVRPRDIVNLTHAGVIDSVDLERFGPR